LEENLLNFNWCFEFLCNVYLKHRLLQGNRVKYDTNAYWSSYKVTYILVTCERGFNFQTDFRKNSKIKFYYIGQEVEGLFHVDLRAD